MDPDARKRCEKRMATVDAMSPELRAIVHDEGLTVVQAFLDCGVTKPARIRHLIETVRRGSTEIGNRTESPALMRLFNEQGLRLRFDEEGG